MTNVAVPPGRVTSRSARRFLPWGPGLAIVSLLLAALAMANAAAATSARQLATAEAQAVWQAVGRINLAGRGFCTGTLISDRQVLTAAHCMFNPRTGRLVNPENVHFLAGYRKGTYAARRLGARVTISARYDQYKTTAENLPYDIAILELAEPIPDTVVAPLELGCCGEPGEPTLVLSYGMDRPEALSVQDDCVIQVRRESILVTDCEATPGVSGAPLLRTGPQGAEVIGVVSVMRGRVRAAAIAVSVEGLVSRLRQNLRRPPE